MNHRSFLPFVILPFAFSALAQPQQFQFREPHMRGYTLEPRPALRGAPRAGGEQWLEARPDNAPDKMVEIGSRLFVRMHPGKNVNDVIGNSGLQLSRVLNETSFIFQAKDAMTALQEAERISQSPDVAACTPIMRRPLTLQSTYTPNDPYLSSQWNLSNRDTNGAPLGADLNIRNAWNITRGQGVTLAVADDGVELTHPELSARGAGGPHFNFQFGTTNGNPVSDTVSGDDKIALGHGTSVAGMAVATGNNGIGIVGVAPEAKLASWVIFTTNIAGIRTAVDDEKRMDAFQYSINSVAAQNHSWGHEGPEQNPVTDMEKIGIANAIENGRGGKGVVMVRGVGNFRFYRNASTTILANANDDGYPADRRVIAVGGVNATGRVSRYSSPGACVLVAAPVTESISEQAPLEANLSLPSLFMVDRQGPRGFNMAADALGDFTFSNNVRIGVSFAIPQVTGLAALLLSANTNLSYRDVQQILALSARHVDLADPDLSTNGAGLLVSHNVGFGVPDATVAVGLAQIWTPRPALASVSLTNETPAVVPDDGLRVVLSNAPPGLQVIAASPTTGKHIDEATAMLPIVDLGAVATNISTNLTGKIALIQRGGATFAAKIQFAAEAGASGVVIYNNNTGGATDRLPYGLSSPPQLCLPMTGTDFSPIPAVFINRQDGEALRNFVSTNQAHVQLNLLSTNYVFTVTNNLLCEHIEVEVDGDNTDATGSTNARRGDVRITLLSPSGTRSVLQRLNTDTNKLTSPGWTYSSTHHFFESSAGEWTVAISDESPGATNVIRSVVLRIHGTEINDSDHDGLDDSWETTVFGNLSQSATDDFDNDGFSNAREQAMGTSPVSDTCNFTLSGSHTAFGSTGGTNSVNINGSLCAWTIINTNAWITITSPSQGLGNGSVNYRVSTNTSTNGRSSTIIVAGLPFTITQAGTTTPLSLAGKTVAFHFTNSTGFPTNGRALSILSTTNSNYRYLTFHNTNTVTGQFNYAVSGTNSGTLVLPGAATNRLTFLTPVTGLYISTNQLGEVQQGTFVIRPNGADFDGNGASEILFQNGTKLACWLMKPEGTNLLRSIPLPSIASGWRVVGIADFNRDDKPDILLQHTSSKLSIRFMNGTNVIGSQSVRGGAAPGTAWKAVATGDFNGDQLPDILLHNTNGKLTAWLQNGTASLGSAALKAQTTGWRVVGVADMNFDGYNDILFQHSNAKFTLWKLKGAAFLGSEVPSKTTTSVWSARSLSDLNGDGKADILFQNTSSGITSVWYMNGKNFLSSGSLNSGKSVKPWQLVGPK